MEVSIIVPIYNVEKYLPTCLDSILNQTFKDFELILVNDGSTDNSPKICENYALKDARIKIVNKENGGLSSARNAGIQVAKGNYIGFIDSDDYIHEKMYEILFSNIKEYNADVATCGLINVYNTTIEKNTQKPQKYFYNSVEAYRQILIGNVIPVSCCSKLIKRELLTIQSFPLKKHYEDAFFNIELMQKAKSVIADTTPLYYYIHRIGSITTSTYNPSSFDVIEAYNKTMNVCSEKFPQLMIECEFRMLWAHFIVLDRMLAVDNYSSFEHYYETKKYLKKNVMKILKNPYFTRNRKLSAIVLKVNIHFYRLLTFLQSKKNSLKS